VDTDNHTISTEVTSLSPFLAAMVETVGADSSGGGGGSGGGMCFITTAQGDDTPLLGYLFPAILLLGFALFASTRKNRSMEN
jgi:hypothetical protein